MRRAIQISICNTIQNGSLCKDTVLWWQPLHREQGDQVYPQAGKDWKSSNTTLIFLKWVTHLDAIFKMHRFQICDEIIIQLYIYYTITLPGTLQIGH